MKYIVILGDGMADLPYDGLGGKTPLEVASKPNIDALAQKSVCGMCKTVPDGIKPGSDVANLSVMGYSPLKYYSGRSPLEALSIGVNMADDDLAIRCNLVTLSDEEEYAQKSMVDYSAGEISSEEAAELIASVQEALGNEKFAFYSGVSYRHCLIRHHGERGTEFTPPHDISGRVVGEYLPKGLYGEEMLDLMIASYDILKDHPINKKRMEEGKNPANSIWLWGEGSKPALPNFEATRGLKGAVISAVDLLKGIAIAGGMKVIEVEGATGTVKTNFTGKAEACVQAIRDGFDYVYLHMEAPDECGHQGDSEGKVKSIELIDEKVVGYILDELKDEDLRILVCPDHPTPLVTKTHSSAPIPFLIYDSKCIKDGVSAYTENECSKTGVKLNSGDELVEMFLKKEEDREDMNEDMMDDELILPENDIVAEDEGVENEIVNENNQDEQDEEASQEQDDDKEASEEDSNANGEKEEDASKIDPKSQKDDKKVDDKKVDNDKKGDKKADKKPMSPKKKKFLTIVIAVAVLAVLITIAVVTPILVINAPKVLISKAEDFTKPVKDKKELYYLQKDVTINGDLTLALNVDLNNKVLTVNGTLTIDSPKGGNVILGDINGKDYALGGKISAKKLVVKNAKEANLSTIITADEIEFDHVAKGVAAGSIQANNLFDIKSSDMSFSELAFGENISNIDMANSSVVLNKATKIDINLENSKLSAMSDVGNINLDNSSELRLYGAVYSDFDSSKLGNITGGKLVYIDKNAAFETAKGMNEIWVTRDFDGGNICVDENNIHHIDILETPQFIDLKRDDANMLLELSSVDSRATKVVVTIDDKKEDVIFDIASQNISKDGGYLFNLGDRLNTVGNHSLKIVLRSNNPDFIKDSDPYFKKHTHYITLDRVGNPQVTLENNEYWLNFNAVNFAETYEIVFDGIMLTIPNESKKAGEVIRYNLSKDNNFKPLLDVPGNHLITIVSKSSMEGINPSDKAYAKFAAITKKLASPTLTIKNSSDGLSFVFGWNAVENASSYIIKFTGTGKETITWRVPKLEFVIAKAELEGYDTATIVAVGKDNYYENSDPATLNFGLGA